MEQKFSVTGMTCTACSAGIERTVKKLDGVSSVAVSLMGESMVVQFDPQKTDEQRIIAAVRALGYGAERYEEKGLAERKPQPDKLKKRFFLSLCLLLPLMYFSMGGMISLPQPKAWISFTIQMLLSAAIIAVNFKFFTSGTRALLKRVPNMDTLVAMGSAVSFLYSFVLTVLAYAGKGGAYAHMFYESAAMILTLVTLGKWLEEKSKRKTGDEVEKLIKLMPATVTVEESGVQIVKPFSQLRVGDILIVKQGDYVPVDGKVTQGHGFVDRSAITGESLPIEVSEGASVTGADVVTGGFLRVRAEKVGADTTLSRIVKMVKEAGASKAPIQKIADRIAGVFVPAVTLIAAITFFVWVFLSGKIDVAANYAISVLVISCPCSLGLATPVAVMAATGRGMSMGILFKDAEALQKAKEVNCALLDKTATLTVGKPQVTDFVALGAQPEFCLPLAAAIESHSNHPIAKCVQDYAAQAMQAQVMVEEFRYETGKGATATYEGKRYCLGNRKLLPTALQKEAQKIEKEYEQQGKTLVFMAEENKLLAVFAVADVLKESSGEAILMLKERSVRTAMLTGDSENVAKAIAQKVGIDEYFAEALPEDKAKSVGRVRAMGGYVAMVGDGINDSPALKEADVGVAMGTGTDIAIDSADVVLVSGDLRSLSTMIDLSKAAVKNIKQNLFWAFFYNCVAIPVAAGVFAFAGIALNPMIAAACMSLSSLFVVTNALRLTKFGRKNAAAAIRVQQPQEEEGEEGEERVALSVENKMETNKTEENNAEQEDTVMKTVYVEGMMCMHCVSHVKKAISAVDGVAEVEVLLAEKKVNVRLAQTANEGEVMAKLKAAVEDAGYEVTSIEG